MIPGPCQLEGLLSLTDNEPNGLALICHPHPLYQGTMHNKVVTTLARAAAECGYASLRFNFRGVGKSEGSYGEGIGELEDAKAALAFLLEHASPSPTSEMSTLPQEESVNLIEVSTFRKPVIIMGFSFGGYIATELAAQMQPAPAALVTIAPALHYENLQVSQTPDCPWLVVHGTSDEVIAHNYNKEWLATKAPEAELVSVADTGHFFHGKLVELQKTVVDFLLRAID
jgi:alpha/beta superfamily hydrolase